MLYICRVIQTTNKMNTNTKKLSAYTIAANCSDLTDIECGIEEMKDYFKACEKADKTPTNTAYIRFSKLHIKKEKLTKK